MNNYTSVKVPMRLAELIRESDRYKTLGYTSVSQFILEATRTKLWGLIKK